VTWICLTDAIGPPQGRDPAIAARVAVSRDMGWRCSGPGSPTLRKNHETCQERARRNPLLSLEGVPETGLSLMAAVLRTGNRDHAGSKEKERWY
jgi:hypothetical protein